MVIACDSLYIYLLFSFYFIHQVIKQLLKFNAQKRQETPKIRRLEARAKPTMGKPINPFLIESSSTREIQVINELTNRPIIKCQVNPQILPCLVYRIVNRYRDDSLFVARTTQILWSSCSSHSPPVVHIQCLEKFCLTINNMSQKNRVLEEDVLQRLKLFFPCLI